MLCSRPVQAYAQLQYPTSDSLCARASAEVVFDEAQPASDEAEPSSDEAGEDATSPEGDADAEGRSACRRQATPSIPPPPGAEQPDEIVARSRRDRGEIGRARRRLRSAPIEVGAVHVALEVASSVERPSSGAGVAQVVYDRKAAHTRPHPHPHPHPYPLGAGVAQVVYDRKAAAHLVEHYVEMMAQNRLLSSQLGLLDAQLASTSTLVDETGRMLLVQVRPSRS